MMMMGCWGGEEQGGEGRLVEFFLFSFLVEGKEGKVKRDRNVMLLFFEPDTRKIGRSRINRRKREKITRRKKN